MDRSASLRVAAGLAAGILAHLLAGRGATAPTPLTGEPGVWVADHEGDSVVLLRDDLLELARCSLPGPYLLAARPDGKAWVAAGDGTHSSLHLVDGAGSTPAGATGRVLALGLLPGGEALLLEQWSGTRVVSVQAEHAPRRVLLRHGRATAVAPARRALAVGDADGWLLSCEPSGRVVAARRVCSSAVRAIIAADGGGWWVVEEGRVMRVDGELDPVWSGRVPAGARRLALVAGRPWTASPDVLSGPGAPAEEPSQLRPRGITRIAGAPGHLVTAAAGAVLLSDAAGRTLATQGGFDWVADVSVVPRRSVSRLRAARAAPRARAPSARSSRAPR